jgi:hypothetical protein
MDFNIKTDKEINSLDSQLGYWLWNIAVSLAPYDTGNLRRAITMNKNSQTRIRIVYNAFNAIYLHYLEMGDGPVKKHKGYISELTVPAFIQEIIKYLKTGNASSIISLGKPMATLRESETGTMFYERKILKSLGREGTDITADDRRKLSQIRFRGLHDSNMQRAGGKAGNVRRLYRMRQNRLINEFYVDPQGYEDL